MPKSQIYRGSLDGAQVDTDKLKITWFKAEDVRHIQIPGIGSVPVMGKIHSGSLRQHLEETGQMPDLQEEEQNHDHDESRSR